MHYFSPFLFKMGGGNEKTGYTFCTGRIPVFAFLFGTIVRNKMSFIFLFGNHLFFAMSPIKVCQIRHTFLYFHPFRRFLRNGVWGVSEVFDLAVPIQRKKSKANHSA